MKCDHKNGWASRQVFVISSELEDDGFIIEFECNTSGCGVRRKFRFDITNVEEVDE